MAKYAAETAYQTDRINNIIINLEEPGRLPSPTRINSLTAIRFPRE
jgi:hypothetical protein